MLIAALAAFLTAQEPPVAEPVPAPAAQDQPVAAPVSEIALSLFEQLPASLEGFAPQGRAQAVAVRNFTMAGREDLALRVQPGLYDLPPCPLAREDGIDAAIAAAREAQIVIINEAHNQPRHRWTIAQLGGALSDQFTVFAAETFNHVRLTMRPASGPLGWYDREPVFARQVNALRERGYRFAAYEIRLGQRDSSVTDPIERIAMRQEAQAENLIADVLEEEPDARLLIHVGHSHVFEAPQALGEDQAPLRWFAARLKDRTGIDPLTISQTHCALAAPEASADGAPASPPAEILAWPVLVDGASLVPADAVDLFLAHPPMSFTDLRPDWRRQAGDVAVDIPQSLRPAEQAVIIEARPPGASLDAMPGDRVLLFPGEIAPVLVPPGDWVLTAWTRDGAFGEPVSLSTP